MKAVFPIKPLSLLILIFLLSGASSCPSKEKKIVVDKAAEKKLTTNQTDETRDRFGRYLVPFERYSVALGARLQKKHHALLIGLAREMTDTMKLKLRRGSIGFYFDKKSKSREELYLGFDVLLSSTYADTYVQSATDIVRSYLKKMLETISNVSSVFREDSVTGVVVGWRWEQADYSARLNIWLSKRDMYLFLNGLLTFEELVQRSTVTNAQDNIIRLPL